MLKDGQIDLQDAYENGDHKTYFSAIERHLKLTEAIDTGLMATQKIKALSEWRLSSQETKAVIS